MNVPERLYLDHASTSWPKAPGVVDAMTQFMTECGASASRGNYRSAQAAGGVVSQTRQSLASLIGAGDPSCVTFHSGCTQALNVAIHGLAGHFATERQEVVVGAAEHNAVLRPVRAAVQRSGARMRTVPCDQRGLVSLDGLAEVICDQTRMIALTHASNVTGVVQPVAEVGRIVAEQNAQREPKDRILFLCDAAQTFGYLPVDVPSLGVHVLAAPAHKGSGGPVGIAMLYLHADWHHMIEPIVHGGSGHDGTSDGMPETMPGRLEPGTQNVPAIAGWRAAIKHHSPRADEWSLLAERLHDGLRSIDGVRVVGERGELPIASLDFGPLLSPAEAAAILDSEFGIEVRAGYHCAALVHECLGTQASGTLRISCGHGTTEADVDRVVDAVREIAAEF
ncbi:MAG: aminotransferase class V-fold PLP-dependent enzyme [Rhodopirellula sp. JB044]|uniref:aminotransferase class V-fold PLP-dependent enzyme n=1 Tax=Rhodopirellula sp. JB044 TaxID=3342844 RepID=UPI00370BF28B